MAVATRPPQSGPAAASRHAASRRAGASSLTAPIFVLLLGAATGLPLSCSRSAKRDDDAIRALVAREAEATNAKDLKSLAEVWSQDEHILLFDVQPPGRFEGWEQIGRLFKDFFDRLSEVHLTFDDVRVEVEGGIGYATYDWAMTGRMGEYALNDRGQTTAIYRKEGGGWRLVHAHYSSLPPASAEQAAGAPAPAGPSQAAPAKAGPAQSAPRPAAPGATAAPTASPGPAASRSGAAAPAASPSPGSALPPR